MEILYFFCSFFCAQLNSEIMNPLNRVTIKGVARMKYEV